MTNCGRKGIAGRRIAAHLLAQIPEVIPVGARNPRIIGTRFVDDRHLHSPALGLAGARHGDMNPVGPPVAIGVEIGLHPEIVPDPVGRIGKGGNDLGLAVLDHGAVLGGGRSGGHEEEAGKKACRNSAGAVAGKGGAKLNHRSVRGCMEWMRWPEGRPGRVAG